MIRLEMKNCKNVRLSGKIDTHGKCKEILPYDQSRAIEQADFTCSPLEKALEKSRKTIDDQGENQITANRKRSRKTIFRHRSKIKCLFVFRKTFK